MKVLYFISYPYQATGSQRSLYTTVTQLPDSIEPQLLLSDEGYVRELFEGANIPCSVLRPTGPLREYGKAAFAWTFFQKICIFLFHYLPYQWRLWQFLRQGKFNIIHCNSHRSTVLIALAARWAGIPIVTHLRNEVRFRNLFTRLYERYSDVIITVSDAIRKDVAPAHQHKVVRVYNGLLCPDLSNYPKKTSQKIHFICLSLIVPHKGLHHLIAAAALLKQRGLAAQFHISCLGPFLEHHEAYRQFLMQQIEAANLDNIQFLGYQKDPFPYLAAADVVVLPSISEEELTYAGETHYIMGNEGLPRVLLEACGFGKPAIAFDVPGVREIIEDSYNGWVVEAGNATALADAMQACITSPQARKAMGENAQAVYEEKFAVCQNVEGVVAVYQQLLKKRRG